MAKKQRSNEPAQPVQPGVRASIEGSNVVLKGNGTILRVPLAQPGPPKEVPVMPYEKCEFIEIQRLFRLGIDSIDVIGKLLNFERDEARGRYAVSLREHNTANLSDELVKRLEGAGDFCEHSVEFQPLALTGYYPDKILAMRKQRPELFRNIPNVYAVKGLVQEKGVEGAAKKLLFDVADFQRWLKDHEQLLSKL